MNSKDLNITDTSLLKQLNETITTGNKLRGDGESRDEAKDSLRLKQGRVIKFYPARDKSLVELNTGGKVWCKMIHPILSSGMNVSFVPRGFEGTDSYGLFVEPYESLFVLCLEIEYGSNSKELACLGFICLDEQDIAGNGFNGEVNLKVGDSEVSITNDRVNIIANSIYWNGMPLSKPKFDNIYEKSDVDDTIALVKSNIESLNTDILSRLATLEDKVSSLENNKTTIISSENSPVISTSNTLEKGNLNITTNLQTTTDNNLFYGDIILITITDNYQQKISNIDIDFKITRCSTGASKTYTQKTNNDGMAHIQANLSKDKYTLELIHHETNKYNYKTSGLIPFTII